MKSNLLLSLNKKIDLYFALWYKLTIIFSDLWIYDINPKASRIPKQPHRPWINFIQSAFVPLSEILSIILLVQVCPALKRRAIAFHRLQFKEDHKLCYQWQKSGEYQTRRKLALLWNGRVSYWRKYCVCLMLEWVQYWWKRTYEFCRCRP